MNDTLMHVSASIKRVVKVKNKGSKWWSGMFPHQPLVAEAIRKIETHDTGFIGAAKLLALVAVGWED
jgi:hypothetical protein